MTSAKLSFAALLPTAGQGIRSIPNPGANQLAVVLHVQAGAVSFLLGSDLENRGWEVLLASPVRQRPQAQVFKIAHHGSAGADHSEIWLRLLTAYPVAVLSPFSPQHLPRPEDLARIAGHSDRVYVTAPSEGSKPEKYEKVIEKKMNQIAGHRRTVASAYGQVRIRAPHGDPAALSIDTFGRAYKALCGGNGKSEMGLGGEK